MKVVNGYQTENQFNLQILEIVKISSSKYNFSLFLPKLFLLHEFRIQYLVCAESKMVAS